MAAMAAMEQAGFKHGISTALCFQMFVHSTKLAPNAWPTMKQHKRFSWSL